MRIHNDKELNTLMKSLGWVNGICPWDASISFSRYGSNMTRIFTKDITPPGGYYKGAHYGCIPNLQNLEWIWNPDTGLLTCEGLMAIRLKQ